MPAAWLVREQRQRQRQGALERNTAVGGQPQPHPEMLRMLRMLRMRGWAAASGLIRLASRQVATLEAGLAAAGRGLGRA